MLQGLFHIPIYRSLEHFKQGTVGRILPKPDKTRFVNRGKTSQELVEAFHLLEDLIIASRQEKKIIFLDELPWMDAPNSRFIPAFEHFWNGWASARKDILLIICGSATSWIINKIFRNKGGLYNRVTYRIRLNQFSLAECEEFVKSYGLGFNRNMILEGYMVMAEFHTIGLNLMPQKA